MGSGIAPVSHTAWPSVGRLGKVPGGRRPRADRRPRALPGGARPGRAHWEGRSRGAVHCRPRPVRTPPSKRGRQCARPDRTGAMPACVVPRPHARAGCVQNGNPCRRRPPSWFRKYRHKILCLHSRNHEGVFKVLWFRKCRHKILCLQKRKSALPASRRLAWNPPTQSAEEPLF